MRAYGWLCNTAILSLLGQSDSYLSTLMCLLFFSLLLSLPAAWCMYIHPASFHHTFSSQQPNNEALHETVKPAPATMSLHYSWRRLGCLICMKLCADSYDYKLPFVTVKQISVTTIQKCCSSWARDLYLKNKTKLISTLSFFFIEMNGFWLMNGNLVLCYCLLSGVGNDKESDWYK